MGQEMSCYGINGLVGDNETWIPCNKLGLTQAGVFSSCCMLNGAPESRDICDKSGLCINSEGQFRTGLCTDKTWKSKTCVQACSSQRGGADISDMGFLTPCDRNSSTFCCGKDDISCCNSDLTVTIGVQEWVCTASEPTPNTSNKRAFKQAAIGIGLAAGTILMVEALSAQWLWRQNRRIKLQIVQSSGPSSPTELETL
ncbi:hypothetical protein CGCTS75_v013021 [Colletotrichum tropicale]|nr:hypothetical protein CGCTS75_v013021 [Colletotrichum tropicale]